MRSKFLSIAIAFLAGATVAHFVDSFRSVHAQDNMSGLQAFQLTPVGRDAALTFYDSASHTVYVYPAVTQGSSQINCEFSFQLTRPGGPLQRKNCSSLGR